MTMTDPILLNNWYAVAKTEDCQPGQMLTTRLFGEELLLWRADQPQAAIQIWQDYCPHRGCRLSLGELLDSTLVCPYHGWQYNTSGQCLAIPAHPTQKPPATAQVKTYHVQERYGLIWVCLGQPQTDVPPFPDWDTPDSRRLWCGPYHCKSSGFRLMDNNVDLTHFPFVHGKSVGPSQPDIQDYQVEIDEHGMTIPRRPFPQMNSSGKVAKELPTVLLKLSDPLSLYTLLETAQGPYQGWYAMLTAITPITEYECTAWVCVATNLEENLVSQWIALHDQVVEEDIRIVESQRPQGLPLAARQGKNGEWLTDIHVPSDRASVSYRRWLKQLGITFGVC